MASIDELRKFSWTKGKTNFEIANTLAERLGQPAELVAFDLGVELPNEAGFGTSFKNSLYGTAQGLGQIAGDYFGAGNNNALEMYGREGVQRNPVTIMDGDGTLLENFGSNLMERPGNTLAQIGGQVLGLAAPVGGAKAAVGLYRGVRGLGELGQVGRVAMGAGETVAYGTPSYGQMRDSQEALGLNDPSDLLKSGLSALAIGSIERGFGAEAMLAGRNIAGKTLRGTIGKQALGEAGEEIIQAPFEAYGSGREVFTQETLDQALAGGAVGFIGGGLAGPIGYYIGRQKPQTEIPDNTPTDLLDPTPVAPAYDIRDNVVTPNVTPLQSIEQATGLSGTKVRSRQDVQQGFNQKLDVPQVILDEKGVPYTTTSALDAYMFQNQLDGKIPAPSAQTTAQGQAATPQEDPVVTLYNDIAGTSYKKLNDKKREMFQQIAPMISEGKLPPDEALSIIGALEKGRYPSAANQLTKLMTRIQSAQAVVPVKPVERTVEAARKYQAEMQPFLTQDLSPQELNALVAVNGLRSEQVDAEDDGDVVSSSFRAAAHQLNDGTYEAVRKRFNNAMEKVATRAQAAGLDVDQALVLLGMDKPQIMELAGISEAQAAQEGFTYSKGTGPTRIMAESDDKVDYTETQQAVTGQRQEFGTDKKGELVIPATAELGGETGQTRSGDVDSAPRKYTVNSNFEAEDKAYAEKAEKAKQQETPPTVDSALEEDEDADTTEFDATLTAEDIENGQDAWGYVYEASVAEGKKLPPLAALTKAQLSAFAVAVRQGARETSQVKMLTVIRDAVEKIEMEIISGRRQTGSTVGGVERQSEQPVKQQPTNAANQSNQETPTQGVRGTAEEADVAGAEALDIAQQQAEPQKAVAVAKKPKKKKLDPYSKDKQEQLTGEPEARSLIDILKALKARSANPIARDFAQKIKDGKDVEAEVNAWLDAVEADENTNTKNVKNKNYDYDYDNEPPTVNYGESKKLAYTHALNSVYRKLNSLKYDTLILPYMVGNVSLKDLGEGTDAQIAYNKTRYAISVDNELVDTADVDRIHFALLHEFSHAMDWLTNWKLSENDQFSLRVSPHNGAITPVGPLAVEIATFYNYPSRTMGSPSARKLRKTLQYPLNRTKHGGYNAKETQSELFAQLQALWISGIGVEAITKFLPLTAKYLKDTNEKLRRHADIVDGTVDHKTAHQSTRTGGGRNDENAPISKRILSGTVSGASVSEGRNDEGIKRSAESQETVAVQDDAVGVLYSKNSGGSGGLNSFVEEISPRGKDFAKSLNHARKDLAPHLLTGTQLTEQYGDDIPTLRENQNIINQMAAEQSRIKNAGYKVAEAWATWASKNKPTNAKLEKHMGEVTRLGIHPDAAFDAEVNKHLTVADLPAYNRLRAEYQSLPTEAKNIYQQVRKNLADLWDVRRAIYADVVTMAYDPRIAEAEKAGDTKTVASLTKKRDEEIKSHANQVKELKGPYFPQMRFGDYILVAESNELQDVRSRMGEATGEAYKELAAQAAKLEKSEKHYRVEAFESRIDLERKQPQLEKQGFNTRARLAEEYNREFRPVSADAVDRISAALDKSFDSKTSAKLKNIVTEMHVASLPERHALTRQMKRTGVAGASEQMLRAFAEAVERDAHYLSRLKYTKDLASNMFRMNKETKASGDLDLQNVYNVMVQRAAADHVYQRTPIINFLARASSVFHLGISPAYLLTNMTQPWMVTAPQLAGRFGATKTFGAMRTAWTDAARIIKQAKGGTFMNLADVDFSTMTNEGERKLVQRLRDLNKLDADQLLDMANLSEGISPTHLKLTKAFGWATHHIELVNRVSTALATYRLERSQDPLMSEDKLIERAIDMVDKTQLDYSNENAALFMKSTSGIGPIKKLMYQFRKYQQGMLYLLGSNMKAAIGGDKEARKALAYLLTMNFAMAGAVGFPLTAPILAALALMWDDDDEKGDPETQLRNYLAETFGEKTARVIWKGLPNVFGVDLSNNLGWGRLLSPFPMMTGRDITDAKTGAGLVSEVLFNAAGAPISMTANILDGMNLVYQGDYYKGLARMSPRAIASVIKATEYAEDGLTTRSGATAIEPEGFDGWDLAYRAAGFTPTIVSEHYSAMSAKEDLSQEIQTRRKEALKDYAIAKIRGEPMEDALAEIEAFNEKHPSSKITRSAMLQATQARTSAGGELDEVGVRFRKNEESFKDITNFAK